MCESKKMATTGVSVLELLSNEWKAFDWASVNSVSKFTEYYLKADSLVSVILFMALVCIYSLVTTLLTGNYSQVDRIWSIVPILYTAHFVVISMYQDGISFSQVDSRLLLMLAVVSLWGLRLTYNFIRKGGYEKGGEDYRWPYIRQHFNIVFKWLIVLIFIPFLQHIIILYFCLPAYYAFVYRNETPLNEFDYIATALFLLSLLGETIADQQQWNFQTKKYALIAAKKSLTNEYAKGFCTTGIFKYSRHFNFFCEMTIWVAFYLYSVAADPAHALVNWTVGGCISLIVLFQISTDLTEKISIEKYKAYKIYQKTTSRFIPMWSSSEK